MGSTQWGLGIRLVFTCIVFVMTLHNCVGGGNLTKAVCSEQERQVLLKFKHSVQEDNGMLSSWVGDDCCRWERVGCDDVTGRVVSLQLNYREDDYVDYSYEEGYKSYVYSTTQLYGDELNSCLAELVNLKHLDLSGNNFRYSQIPEFIGYLKQLRYLNLSNSYFSGNIPHQIGNLSNLRVLDLNSLNNYPSPNLKTDDMTWIYGLSKLEYLDLSGTNLSKTQNLDILLYTTPSLLSLRLSFCDLFMAHFSSHRLNSSRGLAKIQHLDLSHNYFKGELPGLFLNMTSLAFLDLSRSLVGMSWRFDNLLNVVPFVTELHLSWCNLQRIHFSPGNFSFGTRSNVQYLDLSTNEIEGKIPYVLTNMSSLLSLDLSYNSLNSSIPIMPNLLKLDITENKFKHIEDVGIWRQCHLKELIGSYNPLEGEIIGPSTNASECSQIALEILYLHNNALNGSVPEAFGRLTNLRRLDLSLNQLTGPIPEDLGSLIASTSILLNSNRLTGPIPESLGKLTSLREFSVSSNFLNGTIPNSFRKFTKLNLLDVSNNCLHGMVSEDLFANFSMLEYLDASFNKKLVFKFTREWVAPSQLIVVRLASCKIDDGFPQWLRTQRKVVVLDLSNTNISGPLPRCLGHMHFMSDLDLSHNKLTGSLTSLPSAYFRHGGTSSLQLQDNLFAELIPKWLCTWTDMRVLDLSKNKLIGEIPNCLWNMSSLWVMQLSSNRLSGVMPTSLTLYPDYVLLNDNNLSGNLPRYDSLSPYIRILDLGENKFSGEIPEWTADGTPNMVALRLHKNNLTGRIPHTLCKFSGLHILDVAHNNLIGSIPYCFGELGNMKKESFSIYDEAPGIQVITEVLKGVQLKYTTNLELVVIMDLSSNKLVGQVPETLMKLDALMGLNLSNNHLSGGIPKQIGNMKSLNSLDLSANELSGIIPPTMADLNFLSYLNLSHNNLSGQIPTGNQLRTLTDPSIYAYNTYLCGAPLRNECSPHHGQPTTPSMNKDEKSNEPNKLWFYLDIMSGFATGFWGIIGVLLFKRQWRYKLFRFCELTIDKIYVILAVKVFKR